MIVLYRVSGEARYAHTGMKQPLFSTLAKLTKNKCLFRFFSHDMMSWHDISCLSCSVMAWPVLSCPGLACPVMWHVTSCVMWYGTYAGRIVWYYSTYVILLLYVYSTYNRNPSVVYRSRKIPHSLDRVWKVDCLITYSYNRTQERVSVPKNGGIETVSCWSFRNCYQVYDIWYREEQSYRPLQVGLGVCGVLWDLSTLWCIRCESTLILIYLRDSCTHVSVEK